MRISDWSSDVCSSDLAGGRARAADGAGRLGRDRGVPPRDPAPAFRRDPAADLRQLRQLPQSARRDRRSEEHTSELQSLMRISYAVFCLKKKKKKHQHTKEHTGKLNT